MHIALFITLGKVACDIEVFMTSRNGRGISFWQCFSILLHKPSIPDEFFGGRLWKIFYSWAVVMVVKFVLVAHEFQMWSLPEAVDLACLERSVWYLFVKFLANLLGFSDHFIFDFYFYSLPGVAVGFSFVICCVPNNFIYFS